MTEPSHDHPIDGLLRAAAGNPTPTPGDRQRSRQRFTDHTNGTRQTPALRWSPRWVGATAAVLVMLVVAASIMVIRPTPAQAALAEIAQAAERIDPLLIPTGSYAHTVSSSINLGVTVDHPTPDRVHPIGYLLPTERQAWISPNGVTHLETSIGEPRFFTAQDEADYHAAGYDTIDQVGQTVVETFDHTTTVLAERHWPTDPRQLRDTITSLIPQDPTRPLDVDILDNCLDLLREVGPTPQLRKATIEVIAGLDLQLVDQTPTTATFEITYTGPAAETIRFTLDHNGQLLQETVISDAGDPTLGIPPGTAIQTTSYQPTTIIDTPPPGG
jgi:hypothetical protein